MKYEWTMYQGWGYDDWLMVLERGESSTLSGTARHVFQHVLDALSGCIGMNSHRSSSLEKMGSETSSGLTTLPVMVDNYR